MRSWLRVTPLLLLLAGCAPERPHGTGAAWRHPPPSSGRLGTPGERARLARLRAERARRERRRLAELYRSRPASWFVICSLEDGEARFGEDWGPFFPATFALVRGERRRLELLRTNGRDRRRIWVEFDPGGERVRICARRPEVARPRECIGLRAGHRDLRRGVERVLNARKFFRATRLFCRQPKRPPPPPEDPA